MDGRLFPTPQIEPKSMQSRHDVLVEEMKSRNFNHNSPFEQPDVSYLGEKADILVDTENSLSDLLSRCEKCLERYNQLSNKP